MIYSYLTMSEVELDNLIKFVSYGCDSIKKFDYNESVFSRISGEENYSFIFEEFIMKNIPFVFPIGTEDWTCFKKWIIDGKPDFEYLKQKFGSAVAPVANCGIRYFNAQEKENMVLKDFLDYWKEFIDQAYPSSMRCLYLKDWHFMRDFPHENVYTVPKYFSSDWLNEYLTLNKNNSEEISFKDDYRFVYMGPKGTWTPFHADVFSSFSWSANICGKKRWRFYPPGEESSLKDKFGNLVYDVESKELEDSNLFRDYSNSAKHFEFIQGPGEAVFVPSGWHHQVWNLDDTISINHNWINGCNINIMFQSLKEHFSSVKKEISDCQSMDGWLNHCQIMLNASYGINYIGFFEFLKYIAHKRLSQIRNNQQLMLYSGWELGKIHAIFDLFKINAILRDIVVDVDFTSLEYFKEKCDIALFIEEIDNAVKLSNNFS